MAEAVQAGATASDLAAMGFNSAQIATQAGAVAANELAAQGINPALASGLVGGAKGAATSAIMGGNPLSGAVQGGAPAAAGAGGSWFSDFLGGGGNTMADSGDIFSADSGLYDGLDPSWQTSGGYDWGSDYEGIGNVSTPNVNWGKIFTAALGAGLSVAAATQAANAQAGAANTAANASTQAAQAASAATLQGTRESIAAQERALATSRSDFAPFLQPADRALATLQSSVYGEPIQYQQRSLADLGRTGTPGTAYTASAPAYNGSSAQDILNMVIGKTPNPNGYTMADALKAAQGVKSTQAMTSSVSGAPVDTSGTMTANAQQFDLANFKPQETEAYKWQKQRGLEDLRTQLMAMGRPTGTVAANANSRFLGDLNASEYDKGYNRMAGQKQDYQNSLLNLVKIGQGAAGSTSALSQNAANNTSNALTNQGTNLANIATQNGANQANAALVNGQSQANLYGGLSQLPFNIANTAIQGGWKPFA